MDTSDDAPPDAAAKAPREPKPPPAACAPEVECYLALVALTTLLRHATPVGAGEAPGPALADAKFVAEAIVARVRTGFPHRRSMDALSAKARRRARTTRGVRPRAPLPPPSSPDRRPSESAVSPRISLPLAPVARARPASR